MTGGRADYTEFNSQLIGGTFPDTLHNGYMPPVDQSSQAWRNALGITRLAMTSSSPAWMLSMTSSS